MPHISIKHFPVYLSSDDINEIVNEISNLIQQKFNCSSEVISISMEEINKESWEKSVYYPEIIIKEHLLIKRPSY